MTEPEKTYSRSRRLQGRCAVTLELDRQTYMAFKELAKRSGWTTSFSLNIIMADAVAKAGSDGRLRVELAK